MKFLLIFLSVSSLHGRHLFTHEEGISCQCVQEIQAKVILVSKDKGKANPLQAWTGPEGSRRLRLPDFKTIGTWW
jgi:hypothetical protein